MGLTPCHIPRAEKPLLSLGAERKGNEKEKRPSRLTCAMASTTAYASSFADVMEKLTSGGDLSSFGVESTPAHDPTVGTSDLAAVAGSTPQQPSDPPPEPAVPRGSIVRPIAARDFLEDSSLLVGPNTDLLKKLGIDSLKLLHVANGWPWQTPATCHKTPSALALAKQLVDYAAVETPPDAAISDAARATAALALQARHYESGPLAFSLGHIPEFVKTAVASMGCRGATLSV